MLGIMKLDHSSTIVAELILTGSLLHYQDTLMLNFTPVLGPTIFFVEGSLMQRILLKV